MPQLPKILSREEVSDSLLFKIDRVELEFSNGEQRTYECLKAGDVAAVIIVAVTDDRQVALVEEFGIGLGRYELGLPKGRVDSGESHIEAANRELKEEAGYGARRLDCLKCMSQSPNYMQHKTQIVLARDLYQEKLTGDEPEDMRVQFFPLDDIATIANRDDVSESRTIAALYLARDWINAHD